VLVAANSVPPVAKLVEYGKHIFQQKKQKREAKSNQHVIKVKEVKFSPNVDEHDYNFKKNHVIGFLKEGHKAKITMVFRGREITHADLGRAILQKLADEIKEYGVIENQPRTEGKMVTMIVNPSKSK